MEHPRAVLAQLNARSMSSRDSLKSPLMILPFRIPHSYLKWIPAYTDALPDLSVTRAIVRGNVVYR